MLTLVNDGERGWGADEFHFCNKFSLVLSPPDIQLDGSQIQQIAWPSRGGSGRTFLAGHHPLAESRTTNLEYPTTR